ncbi:MAG: hypothetical protein ACRDIB_17945, partial [Ardenticatenaceae bacterium]
VLIVGVSLNRLPQVALLGLLGIPLTASAIAAAQIGRLSLAITSAVGAHLGTTSLLALAFVLESLVRRNV